MIESPTQTEQITPQEQEAWRNASRELIFLDDVDIPLERDNVDRISEKIQEEMLSLPNVSQESLQQSIQSHINTLSDLVNAPRTLNVTSPEKKTRNTIENINSLCLVRDISDYGSIGFTPRFAQKAEGAEFNCLGRAITLGTELKKDGVPVEMAISSDHPYIIATHEGRKYLLGYSMEPVDVTDQIKDVGTAHVIQFENSPDTENRPRMLIVSDFNSATLHEVLESMGAISNLGHGQNQYILPQSEIKAKKVAEEHRDALVSVNWKSLQRKLLPHMTVWFDTPGWNEEVLRIQHLRDTQFRTSFWAQAFKQIYKVPSNEEPAQREARVIKEAREHAEEIFEFVVHDGTPVIQVTDELLAFVVHIKHELPNVPERLREQLISKLRENLGLTN